jgi:hypothetical protein
VFTFDEFPTIDIISPLKSPVKSASVAQDVDKPLKPKYKAKDFHKISSENKIGTKKSIKGKTNEKRERLSTGESEKERKEKKSKQVHFDLLPHLSEFGLILAFLC